MVQRIDRSISHPVLSIHSTKGILILLLLLKNSALNCASCNLDAINLSSSLWKRYHAALPSEFPTVARGR
jgi:hypothetical protein